MDQMAKDAPILVGMRWMLLVGVMLSVIACGNDPFVEQVSPGRVFSVTPSLHRGIIVKLTIRRVPDRAIDGEIDTRSTDAMKWAVAWHDDTTIAFYSADIGPMAWRRESEGWLEIPISDELRQTANRAYTDKYRKKPRD
jgi:hypothetical protein